MTPRYWTVAVLAPLKMFCSGTIVSYNETHSTLNVDTAFHPLFRAAAAKRISEHVSNKLVHMHSKTVESINRHISYAVNNIAHTWMIVVNDSDDIPIFVIRNLRFNGQSADRKVYTIALLKERNEFIEYISYTFNVLLTSLLLVHLLQFIAQLSLCTYRQ